MSLNREGRTVILCAGSGPFREKKRNSDEDGVEDMSQEAETSVRLSVSTWKLSEKQNSVVFVVQSD